MVCQQSRSDPKPASTPERAAIEQHEAAILELREEQRALKARVEGTQISISLLLNVLGKLSPAARVAFANKLGSLIGRNEGIKHPAMLADWAKLRSVLEPKPQETQPAAAN